MSEAREPIEFDLGNGKTLQLEYGSERTTHRQCGSCSLCCRLMPLPDLGKPANVQCKYARHKQTGCCTVHRKPAQPTACQEWTCRWLIDMEMQTSRPDRARYVVDVLPDFIVAIQNGEAQRIPVVQIWCDPDHPHAHRDPKLRAWLEKNAQRMRMAAIVRYGERASSALTLVPPSMSDTRQWFETRTQERSNIGLWQTRDPHIRPQGKQ